MMNLLNKLRRIFETEIVYMDTDERGDWFAVGPTAKAVCLTEETHTDRTRGIKADTLAHREVIKMRRKSMKDFLDWRQNND